MKYDKYYISVKNLGILRIKIENDMIFKYLGIIYI